MREGKEHWRTKFENAKSSGDFQDMLRKIQGNRKCSIDAIKGDDGKSSLMQKRRQQVLICSCS